MQPPESDGAYRGSSRARCRSWHKRATCVAHALRALEDAVLAADRRVFLMGEREVALSPSLVAFGQYVVKAEPPARQGQHGVLGTAAGLEILASSTRAAQWLTPGDAALPESTHWKRTVLGAWLYLQERLAPSDVLPAEQRAIVLRLAQALRALVAHQRHFRHALETSASNTTLIGSGFGRTDVDFEDLQNAESERITDDLGFTVIAADVPEQHQQLANLDAPEPEPETYAARILELETMRDWTPGSANAQLARVLLFELLGSRESALNLKPALPTTPAPGYRYASTSEEKPTATRPWAFHQAAVVVCIVRCAWTGWLKPEELAKFWTSRDSLLLYEYACAALVDPDADDFRVGLYAAWALSHLDAKAYSTAPMSPPHLRYLHYPEPDHQLDEHGISLSIRLTEAQSSNLRRAAFDALIVTVEDAVRQWDLYEQYIYGLRVATDTTAAIKWRQEHFVVPTLPIVLSLLSRGDDRLLFHPSVDNIIQRVISAILTGRVIPGQASASDGTVNMVYLHEALCEVHDACMRNAARSWLWRVRSMSRFPLKSAWPRVARIAMIVAGTIALGVFANFVYDGLS